MKYDVYLLNYNNYYNRQVKKLNTIADYISSANGYFLNEAVQNINVAFGDGLNTEIIINQSYVTKQPDYVIIEERDHEAGVEGKFSRWFIVDSNLTRGNQYHFTIKRDICADFYDLMMNSTYFLERGYVKNTSDLIFNDEGQRYDQVKTSQQKLTDETYGPWIVGYIPRKSSVDENTPGVLSSAKTIKTTAFGLADNYVNGIENWSWYQYVASNPNHIYLKGLNSVTSCPYFLNVEFPIYETNGSANNKRILNLAINLQDKTATTIDNKNYIWPISSTSNIATGIYLRDLNSQTDTYFSNTVIPSYGTGLKVQAPYYNAFLPQYNAMLNAVLNELNSQTTRYNNMMSQIISEVGLQDSQVNDLINNVSGTTIKDTATGKVYSIGINQHYTNIDIEPSSGSLFNNLTEFISWVPGTTIPSLGSSATYYDSTKTINNRTKYVAKVRVYICTYTINLTEELPVSAVIPSDDTESGGNITVHRNHLKDAPYDMFAIPFTNQLYIKNTGLNLYPNPGAGLAIATEMANTLGDQEVYDIQIVPYCPVRQYLQSNNSFDITAAGQAGTVGNMYVTPIVSNNTPINYIFWCSESTCPDIPLLNPDNNFAPYSIRVNNYKESTNLDMWRLCSPNFASIFEFNAAKNKGVEMFYMSFTYKPYNPYIRIRPKFKGLYGIYSKDARGLILQGDFSVPILSSTWADYELQNKNYLNTFNREIDSLELQQDVERQNQLAKTLVGVGTGAAAGATAGAIAGSVIPVIGTAVGAIVGGAVGAVGSAITGGIDYANSERLRNDALDKAQDLFNYSMENVKAIPSTIRNVGCLTTDNNMIPLLEYYTASPAQVEVFRNKMKYYGMSVNSIVEGLVNYVDVQNEYFNHQTFVKGSLLRLAWPDGISEESDNHFAKTLSEEVSKGLYIIT